jgi:hypothetical protein
MLLSDSENGFTQETVDSVKNGLNDVYSIDKDSYATEEEYKAAVSLSLEETLNKNGIGLSEEELSELTDTVVDTMGEHDGEISDAELVEFMTRYYNVYGLEEQ